MTEHTAQVTDERRRPVSSEGTGQTSGEDGGPTPGEDHRSHLERSERVWDRWSDHYTLSERDFEPIRRAAIDRLDLRPGDAVLDVGCGPGVNFEPLREAVGPEGRVVGLDFSPKMVERARDRAADHGWENVHVVRADAATATLDEPFDAAVATLAMSVMPDVGAAVRTVRDALAPGGQFVVFDLRTVPSGPLRVLNPLLGRCLRYVANWNPEGDVLAELEAAFDRTEVVETYAGGIGYTALAGLDDT